MNRLTSRPAGLVVAVCLLVGSLLPGGAAAQDRAPIVFDSDRRNAELQAGTPAEEVADVPARAASAPDSAGFAQPARTFAGEDCPLSQFPVDPADAALGLGATPYAVLAPRLCAAANASSRITLAVGGTTVEGREVPVVTITRPWTAAQEVANDRLRDLLIEDPVAAAGVRAAGGYDGYRPTIMAIGNIHGDEYEGLDGTLDLIEYLATAAPEDPFVENTEGLSEEEIADLPTVTDVMSTAVITMMPTVNPDGRVNGQRRNANGFDLNRDHITGSQPETRIMRAVITEQQPMLFLDIHGYVGPGGLIEPTTPPHNFAYEYDLYIQGALPTGLSMEEQAFGRAVVVEGTGQTGTYLPYRDDEQGWDDWPPIFTAMYAIFQGGSGHTVEVPLQPDQQGLTAAERAQRIGLNTEFARAAIDGTVLEGVRSREALLDRQLQWHLRGVAGAAQSNDALVGQFDGYDEGDVWQTSYPDAYVIPVGPRQESVAAAAVLVDALLSQRVDVTTLPEATTIRGQAYPAGSWVVNMRQAKRAIAQTMLDIGQDITPRGIDLMYDISGWSHTDLWGATVDRIRATEAGLAPLGQPVTDTPALGQVLPGPADAYAIDLRDEAAIRSLNRILAAGTTVHRAPDGRVLVAPSARGLLQQIAVDEDVTFVPVVGLPDGRRPLPPITVGTTHRGSDLYVLTEVLGFPTVELDGLRINDGAVLNDVDVIWSGGAMSGLSPAGLDNLEDFLDGGGGLVASGTAVELFSALIGDAPRSDRVSAFTNGTVTVRPRADSPVMPARPDPDVTFVYAPTFFDDLPDGWQAEQTVLEGTASGVLRAGHWAQAEQEVFDQADYLGQALTVSSALPDSGRVVLTGTDVTFRDHTKGLFKDLADWFVWTALGQETTADLGDPVPAAVNRVAGGNRIETAVALSDATFPDGADAAVIAAAGTFPDALSAGPLAASLGGPVLLTDTAAAAEVLLDELQRLSPDEIVIVGGPAAVSEDVATELAEVADVRRLSGPDRYATAAAVSAGFAEPGASVVLATGRSFPDALAGGVLAGRGAGPVLLTRPGALPQPTAEELVRLAPSEVLVMGGPAAVADDALAAIEVASGVTARRVAGGDRYETAVAAAREIGPVASAYVATGSEFADALAAVPVALRNDGLILLVQPEVVPAAVVTVLPELAPLEIVVLGGTAAVSAEVETQLAG